MLRAFVVSPSLPCWPSLEVGEGPGNLDPSSLLHPDEERCTPTSGGRLVAVDGPAEGLHDVAQVVAHGGLAGVRVAFGQRPDDGLVLVERALGASGLEDGPVLEADRL